MSHPTTIDPLRLLRAGSSPVSFLALDGTVLEMNDVGVQGLGLTREQVVGRSVFEWFPHMRSSLLGRLARVFQEGERWVENDVLVMPRGERTFQSSYAPVFDGGDVIAVQVQSVDISDSLADAAALRRANEKLSVIFEQSPYLISTYDRAGVIQYINRMGPGFEMKDVIGSDSHLFVSPEFHPRYDELLARLFNDREPAVFVFRDVHGSWWEATLVPLVDEGRVEQVMSFSVDITEKRRLDEEQARTQAQLLHSQKLESLGVLAGGIAHDFNNLLFVISANTELAADAIGDNAVALEHLADVTRASTAAAALCHQMLVYAGRAQFRLESIDVSALVEDMTQLLAVSVSKRVQLKRVFAADLPPIHADRAQLRQVVLNLITNASEAIGDRQGAISVSTRPESVAAAPARSWIGNPPGTDDCVVLEVTDTGSGIDRITVERMFEPFFTTKASGRGLGLSATLGIIRKHGGGITVDSLPGNGTTIRAFFPAWRGASAEPTTSAPGTKPVPGRGLILVIDDEPAVLKAATASLKQAGYDVVTAPDGASGLEVFAQHRERVRLVLLDLTMPGLSGDQVLGQLHARAPGLPVIVMSGYSGSPLSTEAKHFLSKPFRVSELHEAVAAALAPEGRGAGRSARDARG